MPVHLLNKKIIKHLFLFGFLQISTSYTNEKGTNHSLFYISNDVDCYH